MEDFELFTGSDVGDIPARRLTYNIGRYDVDVLVGPRNEFIGIERISVNKDFLTHEQKLIQKGYHDVEEYYTE